MTTTTKLTLVDSALDKTQIISILRKTPSKYIYRRQAKGGGMWDYVSGGYVKKSLNYLFGWMWSFEIKEIKEAHGQVVCRGRLTVHKADGTVLFWKEDIGKADIKMKKDGTGTLDYGNDEKASTTDCLKRCAFQVGIASDIYNKNEFKEIKDETLFEMPTPVKSDKPVVTTEVKIDEVRKQVLDKSITNI